MGRSLCCIDNVNKGPWLPEESERLVEYVQKNGSGNWKTLPKRAGLKRFGKSCRLRWNNYLRPGIKTGPFSEEEEETIIRLHKEHGNKWSRIAAELPGRTDNAIKNNWNTRQKKKFLKKLGIDPKIQQQKSDLNLLSNQTPSNSNLLNLVIPGNPAALSFHGNATEIVTNFQFLQRLQNILQAMNSNPLPYLLAISQLNGLINGIKSQYIGGNFFQPQNILAGSSSPTPLLHEHLPTSSNSLHGELSNQGVPENYNVGFTNIINSSEYSLPPLVSSIPENSIVNLLESTNSYSTQEFESDIFDTLDNFLNDEANNAFLKDILG